MNNVYSDEEKTLDAAALREALSEFIRDNDRPRYERAIHCLVALQRPYYQHIDHEIWLLLEKEALAQLIRDQDLPRYLRAIQLVGGHYGIKVSMEGAQAIGVRGLQEAGHAELAEKLAALEVAQ